MVVRAGEQGAQHLGFAAGAQAERHRLARLQRGALGGGHLGGQAGALIDQAQDIGVDGVDTPSNVFQRNGLVGAVGGHCPKFPFLRADHSHAGPRGKV